ncbi:MAG: hypothetical protein H0S85_07610 [Desulfovibrionaceae bacterium]|nr:hypothetical protein [Desulfovibrionaceae bacterium]
MAQRIRTMGAARASRAGTPTTGPAAWAAVTCAFLLLAAGLRPAMAAEPYAAFDARLDGLYQQANQLGDGMEMLAQQGALDRPVNDSLGYLLALGGQQLDNVRDLIYVLRLVAGEDARRATVNGHVAARLSDIADSQGLQLMLLTGLEGPDTGARAKALLADFSGYIKACRDLARDLALQATTAAR